jgi:heptosyltransferase III
LLPQQRLAPGSSDDQMQIHTKVLIIKPGALGDSILALPAVGVLKQAWPDAEFCWIGYPAHLEWLKGTIYLDTCLSIDSRLFCHLFDGLPDNQLREFLCQYDYCVAWVSDAAAKIGPLLRKAFGNNCLIAPPFPKSGSGVHAGDYLLQTLRGAADPRLRNAMEGASSDALFRAARFSAGTAPQFAMGPPRVMIHPGSGDPRKCWPLERFQSVAETLRTEIGAGICWLLGPAEQRLTAELRRYCREKDMELKLEPPLRELASILQDTRDYLGNDSGVTHLAAALGTETWALFGPTSPLEWAPHGAHVHVFWLPEALQPGFGEQHAAANAEGKRDFVSAELVSKAILDRWK